jgi:hypothetical protein
VTAFSRFLSRRGEAATLYVFAPAGSDTWGDPTSDPATATTTVALVRLMGSPKMTMTVAGTKVEIDAEILVPDDLTVDPDAEKERPELEVGGKRYLIWAVDDTTVPGGRRLLATRK